MASINFSDVQCGKQLTGASLKDNTAFLAEKMGLSQNCIKTAINDFTTGQMSGQVSIPFAKMRADASFTNSNNKMTQSGCGQFLLNSSNIMENIQNIKCVLNENQNNTTVSVSAGNSIKFTTVPLTPEEQQAKAEATKLLVDGLVKVSPDKMTEFKNTVQVILDSYDRSVTITNSKLVQKTDVNVKTLGTFSSSQISEIDNAYKNIAKDVVKNNIEKTIGTNAMDENTKKIVSNNTEKNLTNSSQNIKRTLNSVSVSASSKNEFEMKANGPIVLDNFQLEQSSVINMATELIVADAIKDGLKATAEIMKDSVIENVEKTEVKGVEEQTKQVGEVNTKAMEAQKLEDFPPIVYIVIAIIAIVILIGLAGAGYFYAKKNGMV